MIGVDEAVPRALHALLGDDWRDRLKQAVARQMAPASPASPEPKKRALTDAQREARRASMLAINAARAAAKAAAKTAPVEVALPPAERAVITRRANQVARKEADMADPALNAEEAHQARERLAKGQGAMELREWFGGGLSWWQAWCERERRAA